MRGRCKPSKEVITQNDQGANSNSFPNNGRSASDAQRGPNPKRTTPNHKEVATTPASQRTMQ
jgi:hypothetical protein